MLDALRYLTAFYTITIGLLSLELFLGGVAFFLLLTMWDQIEYERDNYEGILREDREKRHGTEGGNPHHTG